MARVSFCTFLKGKIMSQNLTQPEEVDLLMREIKNPSMKEWHPNPEVRSSKIAIHQERRVFFNSPLRTLHMLSHS